ncbi:MAG: hypothetical protein HQ509_05460 [Candidatus Marinimicrobia bacterium]|nr:hypothetical protein [Candidatus Neomarinimicrobiota bacterium]
MNLLRTLFVFVCCIILQQVVYSQLQNPMITHYNNVEFLEPIKFQSMQTKMLGYDFYNLLISPSEDAFFNASYLSELTNNQFFIELSHNYPNDQTYSAPDYGLDRRVELSILPYYSYPYYKNTTTSGPLARIGFLKGHSSILKKINFGFLLDIYYDKAQKYYFNYYWPMPLDPYLDYTGLMETSTLDMIMPPQSDDEISKGFHLTSLISFKLSEKLRIGIKSSILLKTIIGTSRYNDIYGGYYYEDENENYSFDQYKKDGTIRSFEFAGSLLFKPNERHRLGVNFGIIPGNDKQTIIDSDTSYYYSYNSYEDDNVHYNRNEYVNSSNQNLDWDWDGKTIYSSFKYDNNVNENISFRTGATYQNRDAKLVENESYNFYNMSDSYNVPPSNLLYHYINTSENRRNLDRTGDGTLSNNIFRGFLSFNVNLENRTNLIFGVIFLNNEMAQSAAEPISEDYAYVYDQHSYYDTSFTSSFLNASQVYDWHKSKLAHSVYIPMGFTGKINDVIEVSFGFTKFFRETTIHEAYNLLTKYSHKIDILNGDTTQTDILNQSDKYIYPDESYFEDKLLLNSGISLNYKEFISLSIAIEHIILDPKRLYLGLEIKF